MTVNAITDTEKGRTGIAPTYLHTTHEILFGISEKWQRTNRLGREHYASGESGL